MGKGIRRIHHVLEQERQWKAGKHSFPFIHQKGSSLLILFCFGRSMHTRRQSPKIRMMLLEKVKGSPKRNTTFRLPQTCNMDGHGTELTLRFSQENKAIDCYSLSQTVLANLQGWIFTLPTMLSNHRLCGRLYISKRLLSSSTLGKSWIIIIIDQISFFMHHLV